MADPLTRPLNERILGVARSCSDLFTDCLSKDPDAFSRLEAEERRFWVWSSNLKVFARRNINLDAQLRQEKHAQIREMVLLLLNVLKDNLSLALKSIPPKQTSNRDHLAVPLFGIDGSLKRLETVAAAIQHATQLSLTRRVLNHAKKQEDYSEIIRTFSMTILARYRGLVPDKTDIIIDLKLLPSPDEVMKPKPRGLFHSLVKTSVIRYYRIAYERHSTSKLNQNPIPEFTEEENDVLFEGNGDGHIPTPLRPTVKAYSTPEESQPSKPSDETQSESQTQPLSIQLTMFKEKFGEEASNFEPRAERPPASEAGQASYPRAPKISDGQTEATCPICKKMLPADEFEGESWISHVDKDIKPFVCISEACMPNLQYFENSATWIDHMHKKHTTHWTRYLHNTFVWNCPVCSGISATKLTSKEEAEGDLIIHMSNHQSDGVDVSDLRYMASLSVVPQHRPMDICPICGEQHQAQLPSVALEVAESIESEDENPAQTTKSLGSMKKKSKLTFDVPSESDQIKSQTELDHGPQSQPRLTRKKTHLTKVEKCVRGHLKALAFYFSNRLIDDEDVDNIAVERKSISVSRRSEDSRMIDLESLSSVESNDPPAFPYVLPQEPGNSEERYLADLNWAPLLSDRPTTMMFWNEKINGWYHAILSHGEQEWNLVSSRIVKRYNIELVEGHTIVEWKINDLTTINTTKFFVEKSTEFDFKLGWAGNKLGEQAEVERVIARNLKQLRDNYEWDTTGQRIPNPKLSEEEMDRFFPDISCQSRNSPVFCRGQRVDGTDYCTLHKCSDDDCQEEAQVEGGFCQAYHSCRVAGCPRRRLKGKRNASYCAPHACKMYGCEEQAQVPGGFCQQIHACRNVECQNGRSEGRYGYCPLHGCVEKGCKEEATVPGGFCQAYHACEVDQCKKSRIGNTVVDSKFCFEHKCFKPDCKEKAQKPGTFCKVYHGCRLDGCWNRRADNAYKTECCMEHKCIGTDCGEAAKAPGGYCQAYHACKSDECPNERFAYADTEYCKSHACDIMLCRWKTKNGSEYCSEVHACLEPDCVQRRKDDMAGQHYCMLHECYEYGCIERARDYEGYCGRFHACLGGHGNCTQKRLTSPVDTNFCIIHKCNEPQCALKSRDLDGYCPDLHACKVVTCNNPRSVNYPEANLCALHYLGLSTVQSPDKEEDIEEEEEEEEGEGEYLLDIGPPATARMDLENEQRKRRQSSPGADPNEHYYGN